MRTIRSAWFVCSLALLAVACSSEERGGSSASLPDSGSSNADGSVTIVPAGCDLTKDPKDSPNCIASEVGIFVDGATGNDGNSGSKELPVKTIAGAQAKLAGRPRIYVCEGTYAESVKLTSPVSIYGGFACTSWSYTGTKPKISPTAGSAALEVADVNAEATFADLEFAGPPSSASSRSSIAVFVRRSKANFVRIAATAADAANGADSTVGSNYDGAISGGDPKRKGKSASLTAGGGQQDCLMLCTNGITSTGGKGGDGGGTPTDGAPGFPDRAGGIAGKKNQACTGVGVGGLGGPGNEGIGGTNGTASPVLGKLTDDGWAPSDGAAGTAGGPGQGGGGGGGFNDMTEGGAGGGGCGGCGGAPAGVAQGGGGSIALVVLNSVVRVANSELRTGKGGKGGNGAAGQGGQSGAAGGTQASFGCAGGAGGKGGAGGASAGGAGGVSVGIVYRGDKPSLDSVTVSPGAKGANGTGGISTNDGLEGVSQESLEVSL